jgi:riboflavin kinase / FMN adenylyltransferase
LGEGRVSRARHLLARPFASWARRAAGAVMGSKYTVPTINLARYEELVPKDGVYITWTRVGTECFDSVTNVGNRPTFGADSFAIETHLLNFHPMELTPESEVEICFLDRLRDEIKFPSVDGVARADRPRREKGDEGIFTCCGCVPPITEHFHEARSPGFEGGKS